MKPMKKNNRFFLTGLLALASMLICAKDGMADSWTKKANMLTLRQSYCSTIFVGGKIYVIGGAGGRNKTEEYDPETNTWATKADMPIGRIHYALSEVNGKIYALGGQLESNAYTKKTDAYDPETNTWASKADMTTTAKAHHISLVLNGKIYIFGGRDNASGPYGATNKTEMYDPETNTWVLKVDMPTARYSHTVSLVEGKVYVIGGDLGSYLGSTGKTEAYDPDTDTWTSKADMPTARFGHAAAVVDGKIYVIGGYDASGYYSNKTEAYDPSTNTWTSEADMPTARHSHTTSVIHEKIYAVGGYGNFGETNKMEEYNPVTNQWTKKADMFTSRFLHAAVVINEKIYAIGGQQGAAPINSTEEYSPDFSFDIGLRIKDGTTLYRIACEPDTAVTSPLRISRGGRIYGIALVPTTDASASRIRVRVNSPTNPIMAIRKLD